MSTITASATDVTGDPARFDARRGGSHRANASAACMSRTARRAAAALAVAAVGAGCTVSPRDLSGPVDSWTVPLGARLVPTSAVVGGIGSALGYYSGIGTAEQGVVRDSAA